VREAAVTPKTREKGLMRGYLSKRSTTSLRT